MQNDTLKNIETAMRLAIAQARLFQGATAPNPAVGAAGIDDLGNILAVAAHERAGLAHAEVRVIQAFQDAGAAGELDTLVVTLEPCNHTGRTGPCTEAILAAGIKKVYFGVRDPNLSVLGSGAEYLRSKGVEVVEGILAEECAELIRGFACRASTGRPWVTVKRALRSDGSMIPPLGAKTFTSPEALLLAHQLRKRSDAILTGSGTILEDDPLFTVRYVSDHPQKRRKLAILDRRGRVPRVWKESAMERGFDVLEPKNLEEALDALGQQGVLEVLVEAGPSLSGEVLEKNLWNEHIEIWEGNPARIHRTINPHAKPAERT